MRPVLRDPLILPSMTAEWAPRYAGSSDPRLPGISPVYGDMTGLPPIVMQTAGDDPISVDADKIETAVLEAVRRKMSTQDVGGSLGTRETGDFVARAVSQLSLQTAAKFKAYVGDPDFHDGAIVQVRRESHELVVEIEGYSGAHYSVRFSGVKSVKSHRPEGMVLYALSEMEDEAPSRSFHFANSRQPDEEGGDSVLEITAQNCSVERR